MPLAALKHDRPLIVAHRGASKDALENTLPAFELAWRQGADAIEGDFRLTRDNQIVCFHDETTLRSAHVRKVVKDSNLDELKQLDVGSRFAKQWKNVQIPTIAEVFDTIPPGKKLYIEIKGGPSILPKLEEELNRSALTRDQVVVIAFDAAVIEQIKRQAPDVKAFLLCDFKKDSQSGAFKPSTDELIDSLEQTHADGLSSEAHKAVDAAFVKQIRDAGYEYHVWTIDNAKIARKFIDMGAMSITTNVPAYLRQELCLS